MPALSSSASNSFSTGSSGVPAIDNPRSRIGTDDQFDSRKASWAAMTGRAARPTGAEMLADPFGALVRPRKGGPGASARAGSEGGCGCGPERGSGRSSALAGSARARRAHRETPGPPRPGERGARIVGAREHEELLRLPRGVLVAALLDRVPARGPRVAIVVRARRDGRERHELGAGRERRVRIGGVEHLDPAVRRETELARERVAQLSARPDARE